MGKGFTRAMAVLLVMLGAKTGRAQDAGLDDLLGELPLWEQFYTIRGGLGYNDNILYSDLNQQSSPMLVTGFDATLFRLPLDGTQLNLYASVDDRRYLDGGTVTNFTGGSASTNRIDDLRGERMILGILQLTHDFTTNLQAGIAGQYAYQDQVLDVSVTEVDLSTLPVVGNQFLARVEGLARFADDLELQAKFDWQRQIFEQEEVDGYYEYGPRATLAWEISERGNLELAYGIARRDYDTRPEYAEDGAPIDGTRLRYLTQVAELEWEQHLDAARRWRLLARGGFGHNRDSGSGYFDYDRYSASLQLRYRSAPWEVELRGRLSWYQYAVQRSDENPGELRDRFTTLATLRASRMVHRALRIFTEYEFEQAESNLSYDGYTANVVTAGVEWEF